MKIITTEVFNYDELSDKAKEKSREWFFACDFFYDDIIEQVTDDARTMGLQIQGMRDWHCYDLTCIVDYRDTIKKILENAGDELVNIAELYASKFSIAENYLEIENRKLEEETKDSSGHERDKWLDEITSIEGDFLAELGKYYAKIYRKACEYRESEEYIADMMQANEYTFTADGKRFG